MGSSAGASKTISEEKTFTGSDAFTGWKTVLFNCACHTFDQVENQLIKAIRCTISTARRLSWEAHSKGSAVVYTGPRERCEAVASVLESIGLQVKVTQ